MNVAGVTGDGAGLRAWLVDWVARTTGVPAAQVDPARPLQEAGLSSRDAVALTAELSAMVGRPLAPTMVWQYPSITAIVAALTSASGTALTGASGTALTGAAGVAVEAPTVPQDGPVAVVGLGCRLPGGIDSPTRFWRLLDDGEDGIGEVPDGRWETFAPDVAAAGLPRRGGFLDDVAGFDAAFFGITPREAATMDPQQRVLLEVTWAALEHAGIPPASLRGSRTGVFVGLSATEYGSLTMADPGAVDAWSGTGAAASIAANRLSYLLDLRGPSITLDSACSSSLVAVHQAVLSLQRGEIDTAIVAGVNLMLAPGITANFHRAGVLAADGRCKPFDADADGIVRGEGCGVVVLRPLRAARSSGDRVLAVVRGSAVNSDGRSNGITAPNPVAQVDLLRAAYASAGVDPSTVDYVEAHGTGTLLGDPIEAGALGAVLGAGREEGRPLLIGSVKSNLGHLEGAAGITGLIKVVLGLAHRRIPASLHFRTPNPHADLTGLRVVAEGTAWPRYRSRSVAGVSAFGFGGTNAHIVLEEWPTFPPRPAPLTGPEVFALSARSPEALQARAGELADRLDGGDVPLAAVAATLAHRREHLPVRGAVVAQDRERLVGALRDLAHDRPAADLVTDTAGATEVVMVFSGYGSQWPGMGSALLATEPAFAAGVDELEPAFLAEAGFSLRGALLGEQDLPDLGAVQLVLFGMQVALAGLWRAHGVTPAAVIGHSLGEVAAAVVAGALDVTDGLRVMAARARLLAEVDGTGAGAMAVVELSAAEFDALAGRFPDVCVAVYGSPTQCTVTGAADQVRELVEHVSGLDRLARLLPVGGAGHSPAVDAGLPAFRAALSGLAPRPATVTCYPTVGDDPRRTPEFDVDHWAANLRTAVRFTQAVGAAVDDGHRVFVEIAPHAVALAAIEQTAAGRGIVGLPTASKRVDERVAFLTSLARLHVRGRAGALAARGDRAMLVDLPGPVWRHERFWPRPVRRGTNGAHPMLGVHIEVPGGRGHLWRGEVGTDAHPWLADHSALGVTLFPGTGFVELALAAARAVAAEPGALRVADVELHEMLPLDGGTEVTTSLGTAGPDLVEVHSGSGSGWTRHATARILRTGGEPVVAIGETAGAAFDVYGALAAIGQTYGPAFRGLGAVTAAPGRASATVALPEQARDHPAHVLHPALADACLHALAAATGDQVAADAGLYLPVSIGEVAVLGDPRRGVRVDAALAPGGDPATGVLGTLQLVDAGGAVLVQFRDVHCRRVRHSALPVPLASLAYEAAWQRADLPVAPAGPQRRSWLVLHDPADPDAAAAVRSVLAGAGDDVAGGALDDRAAVAALLRAGRVDGVLIVPGRSDGDPDPDRARHLLLLVSGVLAALAGSPGPRLWLVTACATGHPDQAALRGLVRVLAFEQPELRASLVELDETALNERALLRDELVADAGDDEIAWRGGVRHVRRLARPELGEPVRAAAVRAGAYVVTGGLGGLGMAAATWLAERGATRLVLSGRRGTRPGDEPALAALRALGADVQVVAGDVAEPGTAERLAAAATDGGTPLRGVLHAAGVLADGAATALDDTAAAAVWRPKALGAWRLHEATVGHDLDWWLVYSSAAALFGSPGQAAYASANAWVDALVDWRRDHGLPAATINWGAWGEVGAAAGSRNPVLDPLGTAEALDALDALLRRDRAATGIARVDARAVLELFPALRDRPFFDVLAPQDADGGGAWDGMDALRAAEPGRARTLLADRLVTIVAGLMGFAPEQVDRHCALTALGLDSLMAMRARGAVERDFGLPLPVPLLLRGASLAEVADHLADQAGFTGPATAPVGRPTVLGPRDPAERWVARHWQDVLGPAERGVHDDFFAVGGTAAATERLVAAFATELAEVPDTERLFATPTVAAMADLVRAQVEGTGGGPLRLLRPATDPAEHPVFLFHPAGGPTSVYRQLVALLPAGPAVYGFERLDDERTVEGKALRYLQLLRGVAPHGPYRVGGWSFGGCLAYETARLLTAAGEDVDLVVLIDTILPLPAPGRPTDELLLERFERFAEHIEEVYGATLEIPRAELAGLDEEDQIRLVMDRLVAQVPDMGEGVLHHQYTSYIDARVAERYEPRPYDGAVVLLRAKESHQTTTTLDPRYLRTDDALGWDRLCSELEIVRVPGDHVSMIDPPHVAVLAAELGERLQTGEQR